MATTRATKPAIREHDAGVSDREAAACETDGQA